MPEGRRGARNRSLRRGRGVAFLASQVGALSSKHWNQAVEALGLDSRSAMLLWNVAAAEGRSQRELAAALRLPGSRMVELVDTLEKRGWLERRIRPADRRTRELHLTEEGRQVVDQVFELGEEHEAAFTRGLRPTERQELAALLTKLAEARGLLPTVHPGF